MGTIRDLRPSERANWLGNKDAWKGAPTVTRLAASAASLPVRADYRCTSGRIAAGAAKLDALGSHTTNRNGVGNVRASPQNAGGYK